MKAKASEAAAALAQKDGKLAARETELATAKSDAHGARERGRQLAEELTTLRQEHDALKAKESEEEGVEFAAGASEHALRTTGTFSGSLMLPPAALEKHASTKLPRVLYKVAGFSCSPAAGHQESMDLESLGVWTESGGGDEKSKPSATLVKATKHSEKGSGFQGPEFSMDVQSSALTRVSAEGSRGTRVSKSDASTSSKETREGTRQARRQSHSVGSLRCGISDRYGDPAPPARDYGTHVSDSEGEAVIGSKSESSNAKGQDETSTKDDDSETQATESQLYEAIARTANGPSGGVTSSSPNRPAGGAKINSEMSAKEQLEKGNLIFGAGAAASESQIGAGILVSMSAEYDDDKLDQCTLNTHEVEKEKSSGAGRGRQSTVGKDAERKATAARGLSAMKTRNADARASKSKSKEGASAPKEVSLAKDAVKKPAAKRRKGVAEAGHDREPACSEFERGTLKQPDDGQADGGQAGQKRKRWGRTQNTPSTVQKEDSRLAHGITRRQPVSRTDGAAGNAEQGTARTIWHGALAVPSSALPAAPGTALSPMIDPASTGLDTSIETRGQREPVTKDDTPAPKGKSAGSKKGEAKRRAEGTPGHDKSVPTGGRTKRQAVLLTPVQDEASSAAAEGAEGVKGGGRAKQNLADSKAALEQRFSQAAQGGKSDRATVAGQGTRPASPPRSSKRARAAATKRRVLFVGFHSSEELTEKDENFIPWLQHNGGHVAADAKDCTHLVTPRIKTSCKFLSVIARGGVPILSPSWLRGCVEVNKWLDEDQFWLEDEEGEKKLGVRFNDLKLRAMSRESDLASPPVFSGLNFYRHESFPMSPAETKGLIECAGGTMSNSKSLKSLPAQTIVLAREQVESLKSVQTRNMEWVKSCLLHNKVMR